jgi:hypothetical protein
VTEITDDYMVEMRARSKEYTLLVLERGPRYGSPDADAIVWEHGRRNHALRADGALAIVCPIVDDSDLCGIGIFDQPVEEVARVMDGDPGVAAEVFTYHLHPIRSFPGDALP